MGKRAMVFIAAVLLTAALTACSGSESAEPSGGANIQTEADNSSGDGAGETDTYRMQAERIYAKAHRMLTALKAGDIDTLVSLGDPEDAVVQSLQKVADSETAKELLRTIYADLCWEITENDVERMTEHLKEWDESGGRTADETTLSMDALAYRWEFNYNMLLYFEAGDVISPDFVPETEEQAFEILRTGLENTALQRMLPLTISMPDEAGDFCFLYEKDALFREAELTKLGDYPEETMARQYVSKKMPVFFEYKIGDTEAKYEKNDEFAVQAIRYALEKDFEALTDLFEPVADEDYRSEYGAYSELSDAQKAFVDSVVGQAMVTWVDYSRVKADGTRCREGRLEISFPDIWIVDAQIKAFQERNQIMKGGYTVCLDMFDASECDHSFLLLYYLCIEYAAKYIR